MAEDTEEQQVERIKQWWRENGKSIVIGVGVGFAVLVGYQSWIKYEAKKIYDAATTFILMIEKSKQGDDAGFAAHGARVMTEYKDSPYAILAAFELANKYLADGDLDMAKTQLNWIIDHGKDSPYQHIARLDLAKLMMDEDANQSLAILSNESGAFTSLYEELRGDAYVLLGQKDKARAAYKKALALIEAGQDDSFLQMKLDDLGVKASA